jgi:hypothetical protein
MAIVRVQQKEAGASGTSVPTTLPSTPSSGNLLVARTTSVATGRTHTLSGSGWLTAVSNSRVSIFYKIAGAAEPNTITFSCSGGTTTLYIQVDEYSGIAASPLDVTASSSGSGSTGTSGTTNATAQADSLAIVVWGLGGSSGTSTPSFTNSYAADWEVAANASRILARRVLTTTGAQTTTATWSTSRQFHSAIAVFKGAPAAGSSVTAVTLTTTPVMAWVPEEYQDGFGNAVSSKGELNVHAAALTASPTLPAASLNAQKTVTAVTITVTPTFPQAAANATKVVQAATLTVTPTLPVANLRQPLPAATLTVTPSLPAASIIDTTAVLAVPLSVTPTLPMTDLTYDITAATLEVSPELPAAVVTIPVFAATLTVVPEQPAAEITIDTEALTAVTLTVTPTLVAASSFSFGVAPDAHVEVPTLPPATLLEQQVDSEIAAPSGNAARKRHRRVALGLKLRD